MNIMNRRIEWNIRMYELRNTKIDNPRESQNRSTL